MLKMRWIALALGMLGVAVGMDAQEPFLPQPNVPLPQFEVATIKPASVFYIGVLVKPGGRIMGGNCNVSYLVMEAFRVPESMISGGPGWIHSTRYDIEAVPPEDSEAHKYNPPGINVPLVDDQRLMLQALLRDRFGFRYHLEKAERPVLILRRSGKPLKLNPPKDPTAGAHMSVNSYRGGVGDGEIEGINTTMAYTVLNLSYILKQTVIDQTGLTESYDFHVDAPDEKDSDIHDATLEGLKKLGLELKSGKAMVDTIVIDQVSQPTPN